MRLRQRVPILSLSVSSKAEEKRNLDAIILTTPERIVL